METQPNPSDLLWAVTTFGHAALPDRRLTDRLVGLAATLASHPGRSIPGACGDPASTKGAYRFVENRRVTSRPLVIAAAQATAQACAGLAKLLVVHDTTAISYPGLKQTRGLGPIEEQDGVQGLLLHESIALETNGLPKGLLHARLWAREPSQHGKAQLRKQRAFQDKESFKWIAGIREAHARFDELPPQRPRPGLIHIQDREADIHEVFAEVLEMKDGAVIRSAHNRRVEEPEGYAHQAVRAAPLLGCVTIPVPRSKKQPAREAHVEIRVRRLTLCPDQEKHPQRKPLSLNLVEVWEPKPPPQVEALHWFLWTTEEVSTLAQALELIGFYGLRWHIEDVHLVLKEGCRIEHLQMESAENLGKVILLYVTIAIRIVALRDSARQTPQAPCTRVLSEAEWRTLWTRLHGAAPAPDQTPPSLRQAVLWIGRLGGHLGRKCDRWPGVRTLWCGWRDLMVMTQIYVALRESG